METFGQFAANILATVFMQFLLCSHTLSVKVSDLMPDWNSLVVLLAVVHTV